MNKLLAIVSRSFPGLALMFGLISAPALRADLSRYRDFQFGTDQATVARQAGAAMADMKTIHLRPALIQELEWRPRPLGPSRQTDSVNTVVFRFYGAELFGITVNYDRYETEGLTAGDFIEAISAVYGAAEKPSAAGNITQGEFGDQNEIVARWQDSQYRFELIRGSSGPTFKLVGVSKKLQAAAQGAITEAKRLDDQEAPQREAARIASEKEIQQAKLDKSRLVNKPKFRP